MSQPWRFDPDLSGRFHPQYPDDLQVIVHDGEPRRTGRAPESCWVRVTGVHGAIPISPVSQDGALPSSSEQAVLRNRIVYRGTLLNQPLQLETVSQGDSLLFLHAPGMPHPILVTDEYVRERSEWSVIACDRCGSDQTLDPPSVMRKTRFPDPPDDVVMMSFSAFCPCGGTMLLGHLVHAKIAPT